jgi:hypothetical protein
LSGFLSETLYVHLLSPIRVTCPAYLMLLDLITWIELLVNHIPMCS